jgi:transcriptional regulator with XRE-family HTH domain
MAKRGRKPNGERRRLAVELYRQGLTLRDIGARLGVTKQRVPQMLRAAGLTLVELAAQGGFSRATIRGYEAGTDGPEWKSLGRLVRVLGVVEGSSEAGLLRFR